MKAVKFRLQGVIAVLDFGGARIDARLNLVIDYPVLFVTVRLKLKQRKARIKPDPDRLGNILDVRRSETFLV